MLEKFKEYFKAFWGYWHGQSEKDKEMKKFEDRLNALFARWCDEEILEKYKKLYEGVLVAESKDVNALLPLSKVKLVGYVVPTSVSAVQQENGARLVLSKHDRVFQKEAASEKARFCEFAGLGLNEDILLLGKEVSQSRVSNIDPKAIREIGTINVYSRGVPTDEGYAMPALPLREVLTQIPAELVDKVSAFALELEERLPFENYNELMGMYSFKVVLYGQS